MPSLIIYLIKANIALCLFYLAYRYGLRRLTFYSLNRFFLLFGITFSSSFPLVNPEIFFSKHKEIATGIFYYFPDWNSVRASIEPIQSISAWSIVEIVFWTGVVVMASRLLLQLISLFRFHKKTQEGIVSGEKVRILSGRMNPFSFFGNIYINPHSYSADEIQNIISHEKVHVKGWHSVDVLAAEVNQVFYWFNPGVWLMKTAVKENLEFIADRKVLISGRDPKAYQYNLLKLSVSSFPLGIANHFNISHLKMRIKMMNSKRSSRVLLMRYLLLIPVVLLTVFIVRSSEAQKESSQKTSSIELPDAVPLKTIKNLPPANYFNQKGYYITLNENDGEAEVMDKNGKIIGPYQLYSMDSKTLESFNEKFGSKITYPEIQAHKKQVEYLKIHPDITKYSYSDENKILVWTGTTSKIYDLSKNYDRNLLIKKYGSIPPYYNWLNLGERKIQFTPPRIVKDTTFPPKKIDERATYQFHEAFMKRNPEIKDYQWKAGADGNPKAVIIHLKNGKTETYNMRDSREAKEAISKYGEMPLPPPPPTSKLPPSAPTPPPPPKPVKSEALSDPSTYQFYKAFLERNQEIKNLGWSGAKGRDNFSVTVYLKDGKKETYNLNNSFDVKRAESKYGKLPGPPPPPPPPPPHSVAVSQTGFSQKEYQEFLKEHPTVEKIEELDFRNGNNKLPERIIVYLKEGKEEIYNLKKSADMHEVIRKYGMLPAPPPPKPKTK